MSLSFEDLLEQAKNDPYLQITPEYLETWLQENSIDDDYNYLENKTLSIIREEMKESMNNLCCVSFATREDYKTRLEGWRKIEDMRDFKRGKHIRFIHKMTGKMTNAMIALDLKFNKTGTTVMSRYINGGPIALQHSFDNNFIYQKITPEEYMVLLANQYTQTRTESSDKPS